MPITGVRTNVNTMAEIRRALEDIVRLVDIAGNKSGGLPILPAGYAFVTEGGAYVVTSSGKYVICLVGIDHSSLNDDEPERHIKGTSTAMSGLEIDWSLGGIFTKTLVSGPNVLTSVNQIQGHCVMVELSPVAGSEITMPAGTVILSGALDDSVTNYLFLFCQDETAPSYLATISQEVV